jgi:hypothetical protein
VGIRNGTHANSKSKMPKVYEQQGRTIMARGGMSQSWCDLDRIHRPSHCLILGPGVGLSVAARLLD